MVQLLSYQNSQQFFLSYRELAPFYAEAIKSTRELSHTCEVTKLHI